MQVFADDTFVETFSAMEMREGRGDGEGAEGGGMRIARGGGGEREIERGRDFVGLAKSRLPSHDLTSLTHGVSRYMKRSPWNAVIAT